MIETQSIAPSMSQSAQEALAAMFAGLASHFRALAWGRVPPLNSNLLQKIDIAISEVAACTAATHACVAAVVGLRRTLYPDAAPANLAPEFAAFYLDSAKSQIAFLDYNQGGLFRRRLHWCTAHQHRWASISVRDKFKGVILSRS